MADKQAQSDTRVHRAPNLTACDGCHARKIKCDRGLPCGNCRDSDTNCLRTRQKPERKPKAVPSDVSEGFSHPGLNLPSSESVVEHLSAAVQALETRVARIEAAPVAIAPSIDTRGIEFDPPPEVYDVSQQPPTKKRRLTDQTRDPKTPSSLSVGPQLWARTTEDVGNLKAPHSALDARDIIQSELGQSRDLGKHKTESLRSALESLKESLKYKTGRRQNPVSNLGTRLPIDQWVTPPLEAVQWMLTSAKSNAVDPLWSLPDGLPIVSRQSLVGMFLTLDAEEEHGHHPAFVVCVNSSVAYFLLERTTACEDLTGLGNILRSRIRSYFATAQAALNCITPSCPPSLPTLQALVYGLVNAQEVGDASQSWRYTAAACAMCIELGLHQDDESLVSSSCVGSMAQARYCLFVCYVNDKALAMNLGLPPCLPDDHIHVDLRSIVGPTEPTLRRHMQNYYLELAIAQGGVVKLRLQLAKTKHYSPVDGVIAQTLDVLDNAWSMIENLPSLFSHELPRDDLEYEHRMAKFSYYAIRTVLCHLCSKHSNSPRLRGKGGTLASARASMSEFHDLRHLSKRANFNAYKLYSFAHCIVLYYPFTSYFVLFCHVVVTGNISDLGLMEEFVEYLAELKDITIPFEKLHALCLPFRSLAMFASDPIQGSHPGVISSSISGTSGRPFTTSQVKMALGQDASSGLVPLLPGATNGGTTISYAEAEADDLVADLDPDLTVDYEDLFGTGGLLDEQPSLDWLDCDFSALEFDKTWGV